MTRRHPAPELFHRTLRHLGIEHVFGLPGTQNMALFEALRGSPICTVVPTHELAATFMANGYHRVSGRTALVLTIRGPGFAYTLPGMAEAALDSAGVLQLTTTPAAHPERRFASQAIDQGTMARPVSKAVLDVHEARTLAPTLHEAYHLASGADPGPVLVQVDPSALREEACWEALPTPDDQRPDPSQLEEVAAQLRTARRPLLFLGQGAGASNGEAGELCERLRAAVLSTSSGRGIIPESHPLSLGYEFSGTRAEALNELIERSDRILAVGCRFSQNGARGFQLQVPEEKLIHVDHSMAALGVNYPARWKIHSDARSFFQDLLEKLGPTQETGATGWSESELSYWRARGRSESWLEVPEPEFLGGSPRHFFDALRCVLPAESHVVTDSGLHQLLVRRYYRVDSAAGLVMPTGFQSMGFGLPAAIGAKLARPEHRVVALLGDGGLLMSAMELLTAAALGLDLGVVVVNDASYGLIRRSQEAAYGAAPSSALPVPDYAALAAAVGANHVRLHTGAADELEEALSLPGVTLIELGAGPSLGLEIARFKGKLKRRAGPGPIRLLRRLLGRGR